MASIRIESDEAIKERLPPVCMKCGADTTSYIHRTFSWYPGWVYVLLLAGLCPFLIVSLILQKKMRVDCPMCDQHRNHWSSRTMFTWGGFFFVVCLGIGFIMFNKEADRDIAGILGFTWVVIFFVWLIAAGVYLSSAISPAEITDHDIKLNKLSKAFVEALLDDRDAYEDRRRQRRAEERARRQLEEGDDREDKTHDDDRDDRRDDRGSPPDFGDRIR